MLKKVIYIIILLISFISCSRRDLIELENNVVVNVGLSYEVYCDVKVDFDENLIYDWDEEKYGTIIEGTIDTVNYILYNTYTKEKVYQSMISKDKTDVLTLPLNKEKYNLLFFNQTKDDRTSYYYETNKVISTPSFKTKSELFKEDYAIMPQCEEQYCCFEEDIFSTIDFREHVVDTVKLKVALTPISYVYMVQLFIYNDDESVPMNIASCSYMALNGIATATELISHNPLKDISMIESKDVKPLQTVGDFEIFAEKFVIYGLPGDNSSWHTDDVKCELGVTFIMKSGKVKNGRVDITSKIKEKPYGGVLNIILNNSDLSEKEVPSEGFDVDVEDWNIHEMDINI